MKRMSTRNNLLKKKEKSTLCVKDAWNVPILGDPFAFFLDRCK